MNQFIVSFSVLIPITFRVSIKTFNMRKKLIRVNDLSSKISNFSSGWTLKIEAKNDVKTEL